MVCSRAISYECIQLADRLIHQYCCIFEQEFGKDKCYPNLHLHCHLKQCLLDYGPATSFWLNGCLGNFHTNNLAVEVQLFRKFISRQKVCTTTRPNTEIADVLKPLLTDLNSVKDITNCGGLYSHILNHSDPLAISAAQNYCHQSRKKDLIQLILL